MIGPVTPADMRRLRAEWERIFRGTDTGFIDQLCAWGFWTVAALAIGVLVAAREGWV